MPSRSLAERFAAHLMQHPDENPLEVDVINDGFQQEVADVLRELGFDVEFSETRKSRLKISFRTQ